MESTARAEDSPLGGSTSRTAHDGTELVLADAPERGRIEARHDGTLVGHVTRRLWQGQVALVHTVTEPDWQERGIATATTLGACDLARAAGRHVVPRCPVSAAVIGRHTEQLDLVDEQYRPLIKASATHDASSA